MITEECQQPVDELPLKEFLELASAALHPLAYRELVQSCENVAIVHRICLERAAYYRSLENEETPLEKLWSRVQAFHRSRQANNQ